MLRPALRRVDGWEARLAAFVAERRGLPFAWGSNDCASSAIAWAERLTGEPLWPIDWTSEAEAHAALAAVGGLEAAAGAVLGLPVSNWRLARRGDVVLVESLGAPALAISLGHSLCGPGGSDMKYFRADRALKVWRIG